MHYLPTMFHISSIKKVNLWRGIALPKKTGWNRVMDSLNSLNFVLSTRKRL